ncbi:uncharacterized protein LOC110060521 isoform X1 [Orbicella faveolata]|uniref:uncharacterized protein LOC110060521 isoform X1 n=1 Tax=Orbicella faveolata TaxID=48498 RepID=UPI0009E1F511|nr:uncharacterized protein LOC110060521 isoform X1 [Orbicella faveolata]XP_020622966.1 uncharacterized protein LOC110060521 isoform X1 [Orbicella faveolata]
MAKQKSLLRIAWTCPVGSYQNTYYWGWFAQGHSAQLHWNTLERLSLSSFAFIRVRIVNLVSVIGYCIECFYSAHKGIQKASRCHNLLWKGKMRNPEWIESCQNLVNKDFTFYELMPCGTNKMQQRTRFPYKKLFRDRHK